jgi:hypothetical protein
MLFCFKKKNHGQEKEGTGDQIGPSGDPSYRTDMNGVNSKKETGENR